VFALRSASLGGRPTKTGAGEAEETLPVLGLLHDLDSAVKSRKKVGWEEKRSDCFALHSLSLNSGRAGGGYGSEKMWRCLHCLDASAGAGIYFTRPSLSLISWSSWSLLALWPKHHPPHNVHGSNNQYI